MMSECPILVEGLQLLELAESNVSRVLMAREFDWTKSLPPSGHTFSNVMFVVESLCQVLSDVGENVRCSEAGMCTDSSR